MSSLLSAELAATCNALGYFDAKTNKYYADSNTLETAKDLIRYLRRDDESHDIRRQLGETKVLQTDLLPLIKSYWEDTELFDVLLRLLVNLTTPALMLWQEEVPVERAARNHYLHIEEHLQSYKQAFADEAVWAVFSKRISKTLEIEFSERGDENSLIIERILILIRNVLYVPADPDIERRPDNDASIHDQVLWALHQSAMLDIILYISSSITEQAYFMHVLEMLSFMLREQSPSQLANAALQRSQTEKLRDQAELMAIRQRENVQKQQKTRAFASTRHSRFGGTYVVTSMKGISDNDLIYHKPLSKIDDLNFDAEKQRIRPPKNRRPMQSSTTERRSAFSIQLFLKEFCIEFLNGAYNTVMHEARRTLVRSKAQAHDESYYLWAVRFFMEFNRCHKFEVKLVSETMAVVIFHYVQQQMEKYFDMIQTDKKKLRQWSRRLHLALLAYRELLLTLCAMDKSTDEHVRQSSKVIKSNIFYVLEYRELILTLLLSYDELKMSDAYLSDLMETQHIFLKMLESYCKSGEVVVQNRGKKKAKKSGKNKKSSRTVDRAAPAVDVDALWDEASPQLSVVLEGQSEIPTDLVPFDATSDVPIDDQKVETMKNIQRKLRNNEFENAIGLLRAAREVWPENDCFGNNNMAPEEEFTALRDIFFADLGVEPERDSIANEKYTEEHESENEDDEEDEESHGIQISESDFNFEDLTKRLANQKIVRACGIALKRFDKNSALTNHCIIKLLHRIAWDCKMPAMVFQVSIFRTFQKIYELQNETQYKELGKFANYILKEFIKVAEKNPKVYMESLFFKNSKEAYDVEQGYGCYDEKSVAATKAWTELQEDELRTLFMEHKERQVDEDVVDFIVGNLIDNTRSRRAVLKKLKEMYLLSDYKGPGKSGGAGISRRPPKQWTEEEETQLQDLFEQFKDAMDPLGCIMDRLDVKRPKNRIVDKLIEMKLVQDKKELRKKRGKKFEGENGPRKSGLDDSDIPSDSDTDDNSDDGGIQHSSGLPKPTIKKKQVSRKTTKSKRKRSAGHALVPYKELMKRLSEVENSGMSEAIEWLRESLSDAVEDLANDPEDVDESGIPLVPILDCAVSAMEEEKFIKLLEGFGLKRPADEQETYWRIPNELSENIHAFMRGDVESDGGEKSDDFGKSELDKSSKSESGDEEQKQGNSQVMPRRNKIWDSDDDEDEPEEAQGNQVVTKARALHGTKKVSRIVDSDDEGINDEDIGTPNGNSKEEGQDVEESSSQVKKKILRIVDSDEDGMDDDGAGAPSGSFKEKKEDVEEASPQVKKTKILRIVDSDDDGMDDDGAGAPSGNVKEKKQNVEEASPQVKKKISRIVDSDDDGVDYENAGAPTENSNEKKQDVEEASTQVKKKKISRIVDSDDEGMEEDDAGAASGKRLRISDSDSETPIKKKTRVIDSDDD